MYGCFSGLVENAVCTYTDLTKLLVAWRRLWNDCHCLSAGYVIQLNTAS